MQALQRPPHRLDVLGVHRPVRVVEVDPEPDPLGQARPVVDVARDGLAAAAVELGDAERLDVALAGGADLLAELGGDLLLHLELDRQAVAVPAALPRHEVAGHRLEPRVDVLERARLDVVHARAAVGRRRPLVEDPAGRALALGERAAEHVGLPPEREDPPLELREAHLRIDRLEPHPFPPPHTTTPRPGCRDEASGPAVPPRLPRTSTVRDHSRPRAAALRDHGRNPAASTAERALRFGQRLGEDLRDDLAAGLPPVPGSLRRGDRRGAVPVVASAGHATRCGATLPRPWPRPSPPNLLPSCPPRPRRPGEGLRRRPVKRLGEGGRGARPDRGEAPAHAAVAAHDEGARRAA